MTTQGGSVSWDITNLYVEEAGIAPAEVLAPDQPFKVKVDFDGSGPAWTALEMASADYTAKFYAERIGAGPAPSEHDLGEKSGNLGAGPYTATLDVAADTLTEGVYRLGCLILIEPGSGVIGFEEGLVISVAAGA